MVALARTLVLPEATRVGALSAQLRRPRPRSATSAIRRLQPSGERKLRSFIIGVANGSYPTLCCPSRPVPVREESDRCGYSANECSVDRERMMRLTFLVALKLHPTGRTAASWIGARSVTSLLQPVARDSVESLVRIANIFTSSSIKEYLHSQSGGTSKRAGN
jgi:hypothetical protein